MFLWKFQKDIVGGSVQYDPIGKPEAQLESPINFKVVRGYRKFCEQHRKSL